MCFMCDSATKRLVAEGYVTQLMGRTHLAKNTDAMNPDGVGDMKAITFNSLLVVTADDVPDTINTTRTITVDGPSIISTIDTIGDQDFFKVELVAGKMYDIGQYLVAGGPSGVPLSDAYIELYGPDGKLVTNADGGGPNTPSGLDALLTFTPKESGTYYINARAYDSEGANGTTGDAVGDYELFVKDVTGRADTGYKPYYDVDSPLHSLDWGSQVDRTSRNPDGQEGPRPTGNAFTGVGSNPFGIEGKNVITVYYAKAGDVFVSEDPTSPGLTENIVAKGLQAWEKEAFELAFSLYEQVADLVFVEVQDRAQADFKIITYNGTPGAGASLLGRMSPPNEQNEGQAEFNAGDVRWTEEGLQQGGFYFPTLLHEFGHGLGMSHPHDNGGRSSIMRGAGGGTAGIGGGFGDFNLSQQVHTIMSYNDGWSTSPYGQPRSGGITGTQVDHFGWVGTLSPLDIAVIQDKYGVNANFANGDDTYTLKDTNGAGNFFASIWDTGGTDQIVYDGARNANIDLRAATLKYEEGGGGRVSYAHGVHAGFTIANGVTIENARTGSGNDTLTGNDAANQLSSGAGNDIVNGGGGDDVITAGTGSDTLTGGAGRDTFVFETAGDSTALSRDQITDFTQGEDRIALGQAGAKGFIGTDAFSGRAGEVRYTTGTNSTIVELDVNGDRIADLQIELAGIVPLKSGDFVDLPLGFEVTDGRKANLAGRSGNDVLTATSDPDGSILQGFAGDDVLIGGSFADQLTGGLGDDRLTGGGGADQFRFFGNQIDGSSDTDRILDLNFGEGDTLVFGSFASGTFVKGNGVNAFDGGRSAILDSWADIVAADRASDRISTSSTGINGQDLLLQIVNGTGQIENIVIAGGYARYQGALGTGSGSDSVASNGFSSAELIM
jgi:Ca2+-binding RTX toxin-like protein